MCWVSDDGAVEVLGSSRLLVVKIGRRCFRASKVLRDRWRATDSEAIEDRHDHLLIVKDGDELIVRWAQVRLGAAGTEADPRCLDREWRCARVIEGEVQS